MNRTVLLILIESRMQAAVKVQEVLTKFGCLIKTRLGLHDVGPNICAETGLIFLELFGEKNENNVRQGGLKEVGARKSISMDWTTLKIKQ